MTPKPVINWSASTDEYDLDGELVLNCLSSAIIAINADKTFINKNRIFVCVIIYFNSHIKVWLYIKFIFGKVNFNFKCPVVWIDEVTRLSYFRF